MEKQISEPVLKILDLLENEPERFKFEIQNLYYPTARVDDLTTGLFFTFENNAGKFKTHGLPWLTEDESVSLAKTAWKCFTFSTEKQKRDERNRWTKVYCGGQRCLDF